MLSVLVWYSASNYPFDIFKLFSQIWFKLYRRYKYGEGTQNENLVPNQNSIIIFPENGNNIVFHFFLEVAELKWHFPMYELVTNVKNKNILKIII